MAEFDVVGLDAPSNRRAARRFPKSVARLVRQIRTLSVGPSSPAAHLAGVQALDAALDVSGTLARMWGHPQYDRAVALWDAIDAAQREIFTGSSQRATRAFPKVGE